MARQFLTASAQSMSKTAALTGLPFTVVAWARRLSDAYVSSITCLGAASNNYWDLEINSDGRARFRARDNFLEHSAFSSSTGAAVGTWAHYAATATSPTIRSVWLNGTLAGSSTTSVTPTTPTQMLIGKQIGSTSKNAQADIAEVAYYDAVLNSADILRLAQGVSPLLVRTDALVSYSPLWGRHTAERDLLGSAWTHANAPSYVEHPKVYNVSRVCAISGTYVAPVIPDTPVPVFAHYYRQTMT